MRGVLAFDLGASSGRGVYTTLINDKLEMKEVNRFSDYTIRQNNSLRWDIKKIFKEIDRGIIKAHSLGKVESIAVNTWGVDFGLLNENNQLIENPYHYRDLRTKGYSDKVEKVINSSELYKRTGIQNMEINTIYQLMALKNERPDVYNKVNKILLMPDLINFYLTGEIYSERTIASTTQLYNPQLKDWDYELIDKLGLKASIFPKIIDSGKVIGELRSELAEKLDISPMPIVSIASHDTASAASCTPSEKKGNLFLSSGTWSLMGTTIDEPILTEKAYKYNMANETGMNNKITFLKNITGLWLLQETKQQFKKEGKNYTYSELAQLALKTESIECYFDTELTELTVPGNIPRRIQMFAKKTGQKVPETDGQLVRTIYENLALKYRVAYEDIVQSVGYTFNNIYIVGGGSNADFLSQCTANALNLNTYAGYNEATALGNSLTQIETLKMLSTEKENILTNSFNLKLFKPRNIDEWNKKYKKYIEIIENN
ncbi:rhamnulokinase [Globicatella sanguinis]|uniref:rhamnulokinase n=1 Tax=Globicatella sanguinis TaxID=13076 RepID=UPI002542CA14|nr:rhamnulokinase family protein [Globicatella sanguinis]MDK7631687.1 rhamnulokinase family protein [Globicatella sanguinis]WIK66204.1 rhamnulokinase family protein [Globicatella sanguinis]WKT55609.1 rhamnulokinase family protein [Globicatella sanguinis]